MKPHRLLPGLLLFAFTIPITGQVQSRPAVDSLLKAASNALDRYQQQLAPAVHCDEATATDFRDACKIGLKMLGDRVWEARAAIAHYRQLSTPRAVDLFDTYQNFRRVWAEVENLDALAEIGGEHDEQILADTSNNFVKVTGWFGAVVRQSIQDAQKCPDHEPSTNHTGIAGDRPRTGVT